MKMEHMLCFQYSEWRYGMRNWECMWAEDVWITVWVFLSFHVDHHRMSIIDTTSFFPLLYSCLFSYGLHAFSIDVGFLSSFLLHPCPCAKPSRVMALPRCAICCSCIEACSTSFATQPLQTTTTTTTDTQCKMIYLEKVNTNCIDISFNVD